jgi:UDP-N-acetylglucosamine--N-acetylmuramyl-(pentapeptide) pyrophosphoryl-undecaprenol N-acetylglucosamine transferase
MRALLACGGTGGHIYPAIAIAEALIKRDKKTEILFVGGINGMEKEIIVKKGFKFAGVNARPLIRRATFKNVINAFYIMKSFFESAAIISEFKPDVTVGTGGFASYPPVFVASLMGRKTLIHEPNVVPGAANKMLSFFVSVITAGFEETAAFFKGRPITVTGNPMRESLLRNRKKEGLKKFGLSEKNKTVLIMPGSRAAKSINRIFMDALPRAAKELKGTQFIWMTGHDDYDEAAAKASRNRKVKCAVVRFIDDAGLAYSAADAGILRAGAGTLTELEAIGLPSLLVPYPFATGNHQEKNAAALKESKAAIVILDRDLTPDNLIEAIRTLLNPEQSAAMKKQLRKRYRGFSADKIAGIIVELSGK